MRFTQKPVVVVEVKNGLYAFLFGYLYDWYIGLFILF